MTTPTRLLSLQVSLFGALGLVGCFPTSPKGDTSAPGDDTSTTVTSLCEAPESILNADSEPSGYERCADGAVNRVSDEVQDPTIPGDTCAGTEADLSCETDAECTDGAYGRCLSGERSGYGYYDSGMDSTYCGCVYSCTVDADCGVGLVCLAPGMVGNDADYPTCVASACATNDDCASDECGVSRYHNGCYEEVDVTCRDEVVDACHSDADCGDGDVCFPDGEGAFTCQGDSCDIGRPLMVDGVARKAAGVRRSDWTSAVGLSISGLNRKTRRALSKHWSSVAAMEHASVASFARFSLQLMALGAPPELLLATQAAAADEVRHAQITFGIASEYAGAPVGPGALDLSGVTTDTDLIGALRGLILEACVGETLGVAEAIAAADDATDPALEAVMRQIAEDETRHSALAWKTLKWMLDANPALRPVAADAFEEAIASYLDADLTGPVGLDAHGVLSPERRHEIRREALDQIVLPCIRGLLIEPAALPATPTRSARAV